MSGQADHPHVPAGAFTPQRPIPTLPEDVNRFLDQALSSPPRLPTLLELDSSSASLPPQPTMSTVEEQLRQLRELAEAQQNQILKQQEQMDAANDYANLQTQQLQESRRQLDAAQQSVADLTSAFREMSSQPRPLTVSTAPKKKPDLPQFDSKNILIWIRRVEAAYARVGIVEPKDKFSWLESVFPVKLDPQIDAYMYGTNTVQEWTDFIEYLKFRYGPTVRQRAQKLMTEVPRHDMTPSQYLLQLTEDSKDVTVDQIRREHLLKTIPPRIREIMGKKVETMTATEVAKMADTFFDRQGRPLEKTATPVNQVAAAPQAASSTSSSTSSSSFTSAFSDDDEANVNFVKNGSNSRGFNRNRSRGRNGRSNSRPPPNGFFKSSSTSQAQSQSQSNVPKGTCQWHRRFGEKSLKCTTDCPRYKAFVASQSQGNGQGGRRQ